jgi:hypothetical protein
VLNVPVSEVILNEPRIRALIGKGEAASGNSRAKIRRSQSAKDPAVRGR